MLMPMMKITYHKTTYKQYGIDHRYVLIKMIITFTRHQQFSNMVMIIMVVVVGGEKLHMSFLRVNHIHFLIA